MARLGGVTQQGLGDACGVFDSHKKGVFSDAKVVSTTDMVGTVQISTLKMDQVLLMVMTTYTTCA
jgi:hypothetical protein